MSPDQGTGQDGSGTPDLGDEISVGPLDDADDLSQNQARKNYAKVGSAHPTTPLYTYGPSAIINLPHLIVIPTGLNGWARVWRCRAADPITVHTPRLLETVQLMLGHQADELWHFPWQPPGSDARRDGDDLGVPTQVFPQRIRCTGCDLLAPLSRFVNGYHSTHPFRPDQAVFEHTDCPGHPGRAGVTQGRRGAKGTAKHRDRRRSPYVPVHYLTACPNGYLDEFPCDWWVHKEAHCPKAAHSKPTTSDTSQRGATAFISCRACGARRGMSQTQGEEGRRRLPRCRGRHPHLRIFTEGGCQAKPHIMLMGASNLWFAATQSITGMPRLNPEEQKRDRLTVLRRTLDEDLKSVRENPRFVRAFLRRGDAGTVRLRDLDDDELTELLGALPLAAESGDDRLKHRGSWDLMGLLVPEWDCLLTKPPGDHHEGRDSRFVVSPRSLGDMPAGMSRVLAVDRLRKVNAVLGFTRVDDYGRVEDSEARFASLVRSGRPAWAPVTGDRGEGIFIQLGEDTVARWETGVLTNPLRAAHRSAHRRNSERCFSETAKQISPDKRFAPPRCWLVRTLAHALVRQVAMSSDYGAASISERLYAWRATEQREAAADMLLTTTASNSDGALGGLVSLSEPSHLTDILHQTLHAMARCSSNPIYVRHVPKEPEDFLHGATYRCCTMVSETSCERANRFLDRCSVIPPPDTDGGMDTVIGSNRGPAFFSDYRNR